MENKGREDGRNCCNTDRKYFIGKNGNPNEHIEDDIFTAEEALNGTGVLGIFQAKLILFCCFIWMSRGVDEVLLSYIGLLISCEWGLDRWQTALIHTGSLLLSALGCLIYGVWADKYGRRSALSASLIFFFVFGAVSSGLPNFIWFFIFRMLAAFAVGGLPQALTLISEFTPRGQRGRTTFILSVFWAIGIFVMVALLYSAADDWRLLVAISSFPACIAMMMLKYFPESIRYLLISNEDIAASIIMEEVAATNKQNLPRGILEPAINWKDRGRFSDLLDQNHLMSSFLFCLMGVLTAVSYWGLTLLAPTILSEEITDIVNTTMSEKHFLGDVFQPAKCMPNVTQTQFIEIVWTSALDFPGVLIYMILVDIINRKILLAVSSSICAIFIFLLYIPSTNIVMKTAFLYCSRTLLIPQFDLLLIMTAETYPTTNRGSAIGLTASTFYIGSFLNPYIYHAIGTVKSLLGFYGGFSLIIGLSGLFLPFETRNKELKELPKPK